jgi:hypothetical protein
MPRKKLRWHAQVRTFNGGITTYVKVRADTIEDAAAKAVKQAAERHESERIHGIEYVEADWFVIYLGLHDPDQNRINEVLKRKFPADRRRKTK